LWENVATTAGKLFPLKAMIRYWMARQGGYILAIRSSHQAEPEQAAR
jgi:hypothetical protein